jgi:two-component system nitrogen regulation response regulator NtrX
MTAPQSRSNTILVVDDELSIRRELMLFLGDENYRAIGGKDAGEALAALENEQVDLVLLDVWMEGMDGMELLRQLKQRWPDLPVVMISGHGSIALAVQATREGAYDFLEKPVVPERLAATISRALEHTVNLRALEVLRADLGAGHVLLGESSPMGRLTEQIRRVAGTDGRVLIFGENGSGKELVARAIHELSARRTGPFVRLNSAALPRDLIESELFGYEKGAFTGAIGRKVGKFEIANRGTLFLDEVGDMDAAAQAKLLRAIETGEVERLGGTRPVRFDARIISATNKDLKGEIRAGRFREDLYYRLAVVPISVPPLRERGQDIVLLAGHFLRHYAQELGRPPKRFSDDAIDLLRAYRWPGNVRELRNLCERLSIMIEEETIASENLAPLLESASAESPPSTSGEGDLRARLEEHERRILLDELRATQWNVSESARRLGIDRASLHRKIKRFQLQKET